jgi:SHS family lactate transporter-like MFS transporter
VAAYVIVLALIGPENHGSHFENSKPAFQVDPSREEVDFTREHEIREFDKSSGGSAGRQEKEAIQLVESTRHIDKESYV